MGGLNVSFCDCGCCECISHHLPCILIGVGHADRACFDLEVHGKACGVPHVASERLPEPIAVEKFVVEPLRKKIGPKFKANQREVISALENLDEADIKVLQEQLQECGTGDVKGFEISADMVNIKLEKKNVHEIKYCPSVIEPSFGIGRIIYAVLEHSFIQREGDEQRCVMSIRPNVAAIKVGIFRLTNNNPQFDVVVEQVRKAFHAQNITCKVDSTSGTIGRRYARADEIGIPFGITIDFDTLMDDTVTLRERNSMSQVRIPIKSLVTVVLTMCNGDLCWDDLTKKFAVFVYDTSDSDDSKMGGVSEGMSTALTLEKTPRATFSRPYDSV